MTANESKAERPWRWVIYQIIFFLLVLCAVSPGSLGLQAVSKMWLALQSVPHPAFCICLTSTRVGFSDINFELFTATDVRKTCQSKTRLILVLLWLSGRCRGCRVGSGVFQPCPVPPGAAVMQWCLEPARKHRDTQSPNSWLIQIKRRRKLQPAPCDLAKTL